MPTMTLKDEWMMPMKVFLDNHLYDSDTVPVDVSAQGIQYGFSLFETLKVENGLPEFLERHLKRLKHSMNHFGLHIDNLEQRIQLGILDLLKANQMKAGVLKISVLKGRESDHLLLTTRRNPYTGATYEQGIKLTFSKVKRNPYSELVYHKTSNYMECLVERKKAAEQGFDEVLFLNVHDCIAEGAVSNIFWLKGETLYTPAIDTGILNGIMRQWVIERAQSLGLDVYIGQFLKEDLRDADLCFITNSIMGIMPVSEIENTWYPKGNEKGYRILNQLRNR